MLAASASIPLCCLQCLPAAHVELGLPTVHHVASEKHSLSSAHDRRFLCSAQDRTFRCSAHERRFLCVSRWSGEGWGVGG